LNSLTIETYSPWGWGENSKGVRHRELTAHIEIIDEKQGRKVSSFASGGDYEVSKKISLVTIFTRSNNEAMAVLCGTPSS
jgi:hypothetical protein